MTVQDLIIHLGTLPPDAKVVFSQYSENREMDANEVSMEPMILRHGTYMRYEPRWWDKAKDGEPKIIQVCCFPGN